MLVFTLILDIAALILSTVALLKYYKFSKDVESRNDITDDLIDRNRLAIKNLNENFSKRVYEVLEELAVTEGNLVNSLKERMDEADKFAANLSESVADGFKKQGQDIHNLGVAAEEAVNNTNRAIFELSHTMTNADRFGGKYGEVKAIRQASGGIMLKGEGESKTITEKEFYDDWFNGEIEKR
jgi:hypothetical protein